MLIEFDSDAFFMTNNALAHCVWVKVLTRYSVQRTPRTPLVSPRPCWPLTSALVAATTSTRPRMS